MKYRLDIRTAPVSYQGIINQPLELTFPKTLKEHKNCVLPDIAQFTGRLFLNLKAYSVLKPLIENDGEFLPVVYEEGEGYIFIPLRVAEEVGGLDMTLTTQNEWGYLNHLAFHEEQLKDWKVFRAKIDGYASLFCQQEVKDAIENAGLTGLYITPDLANIFPEDQGTVSKLN